MIDAFRGIAISAVLLYHYLFKWTPLTGESCCNAHFATTIFSGGYLGVEFFFIISGFVIFLTLDRSSSFRDFAIRRFARLYPTYLFCLTLTFVMTRFMIGNDIFVRSYKEFIWAWSMMPPPAGKRFVDGAYWSLVLEVRFYVWIGLIYFFLRRHFLIAWGGFCAFATTFEPVLWIHNYMFAPYLCFFTMGMGFYLQFKHRHMSKDALVLQAIGLWMYVFFWVRNIYPDNQDVVVPICIAAMALLFEAFLFGKLDWLPATGMRFIGVISYPLYLIHQNIGVPLIGKISSRGIPEPFAVVMTVALMIVVATLIHYCWEIPSQRAVRWWLTAALGRRRLPELAEVARPS